ncbi:unnamed protein product, partial [marine sediment metagenome]
TAEVIATLPSARFYASGAVWDPVNKCAYTFGGRTSDAAFHDDIMKFDPATLEVTTLGVTLPTITGQGCVVWDPTNHCAYIFSGYSPDGVLDTIVKFDPGAGTCAAIPGVTLPEPLSLSGAVWDPVSNCAYIFGGNPSSDAIVKFDPTAGTCAAIPGVTLPEAAGFCCAAWDSVNNVAYIFGGNGETSGFLDTIVKFDPAGPAVTTLEAKLPSPRRSVSACPGQ